MRRPPRPDVQARLRQHWELSAQARTWVERALAHEDAGQPASAERARQRAASYLRRAMALEPPDALPCARFRKPTRRRP